MALCLGHDFIFIVLKILIIKIRILLMLNIKIVKYKQTDKYVNIL